MNINPLARRYEIAICSNNSFQLFSRCKGESYTTIRMFIYRFDRGNLNNVNIHEK